MKACFAAAVGGAQVEELKPPIVVKTVLYPEENYDALVSKRLGGAFCCGFARVGGCRIYSCRRARVLSNQPHSELCLGDAPHM